MKLPRANFQTAHLAALGAILASLALDIAIKHMIANADWNGTVLIPGFLDLDYAWNRGISFSLFWQNSERGSLLLTLTLAVIALVFAASAFRTDHPLIAAGSGLIVGGALGNLLDRGLQGAVFDFLVVRLGAQPLFVCNSADIFISLGAILLAADMLLTPQET